MSKARTGGAVTVGMQFVGSEEHFRSLVQNSSDVVTLVDADMTVRYGTPSLERVLGHSPEELLGRKLTELVHPEDRMRCATFLADAAKRPGVTSPVEWRMRHREGSWLHVETIANNLIGEADVGHLVLNSRDISERKALERRLEHQAFHDPLTDLANRALFKNRVERAIAGRARRPGPLAVLFLDLDDFKKVNDSLGHPIGDELLVAAARRLQSCLRPADTAARLGGDEFAILLEDATGEAEATLVAERVIQALAEPVDLQGREARIQASVGIALSTPAADANDLLRNADIAMYIAKSTGKGCYAIFEPTMHVAAVERLELESDLRHALERDELVIHYQPIVALATGRIVGVEALVRWNHPQRGLLGPAEFLPIAEEANLIRGIGGWVLREACAQVSRWQADNPRQPALSVSVNLSGRQLEDPGLVEETRRAIEDSGIEPAHLTLEITETVMMQDIEITAARLEELKALGLRLSIDDFGTGSSSLRYLQSFPIDTLKIAKPFVDGLWKDPQKEVFTRTIIDLCRTLGVETLAEGIESAEQAQQLRRLGCKLGQGHHLARALEHERLVALLREGEALAGYAEEVDGGARRSEIDWWKKVLGGRASGAPSPALRASAES